MDELREARYRLGVTQKELGTLLEIPLRTIEDWERGARKPPDYVKKLLLEKLEDMILKKEKKIVDHVRSAAALYDGGWRTGDREWLREEYDLEDDDLDKICILLGELEGLEKQE